MEILVGTIFLLRIPITESYEKKKTMEIDSDYGSSDGDEETGVASRLRRRKGGEVYDVSGANSARKVPRTKSLSVARCSNGLERVDLWYDSQSKDDL